MSQGSSRTHIIGIGFALLNSLSLGILGIVDKLGVGNFDITLIFSFQSVIFGALFATIIGILYRRRKLIADIKRTPSDAWWPIIMFGICASGLFIIFRFLGLTQATGTFATLSQVVTTALTALLAFLILKERLSRLFWLCFTVIILATYVVSTGQLGLTTVARGDMFILIGTIFLAIANIFAKIAIQKTTPMILSIGRFYVGAVFLLLVTIVFFGVSTPFSSLSHWSVISGFFWAVNIIAFSFAIARIGITLTTSILMFGSVVTMILESTLLGQHFSLVQIVAGLVVIMSGLAMLVVTSKPAKTSKLGIIK